MIFQSYMNLGNTLKELSKFSRAKPIYKKTIELNPTYAKNNITSGHYKKIQRLDMKTLK